MPARRYMAEEIARWKPVVDAIGLKMQLIRTLRRRRDALLRELAQRVAVDLVGRGERQFVDEPDEARVLIGRRVLQRVLLDRVLGRLVAGLRDDEGDRLGALDVVVDRHHHRLPDVGMLLQHALDVGRIDVLAAGDEHVVGAADEIVEAVLVAAEHVAGDVEAVRA